MVVGVGGGGGKFVSPAPLLPQRTIQNVCKILHFWGEIYIR